MIELVGYRGGSQGQSVTESGAIMLDESGSDLALLLVEDNPGDVVLVRECLSSGPWRHRIDNATSLADAIDRLPGPYDAILLDLHLPDGGPREALSRIAAAAGDTPIIVLTGARDAALARSCLERGAQDYVVKDDLRERELVRSVEYALARSRERQLSRRLRQMEHLVSLGELAAAVVHEVSNPTTIVYMNSAELRERIELVHGALKGNSAEAESVRHWCTGAQEMLDENLAGLDRVRALLHDLRKLGQPSQEEVAFEAVDPSDLCLGVVRMLSTHVTRRARFDTDLDVVPKVRTERQRLGQVVLNLVMNAVQSLEGPVEDNRICVSTRYANDEVVIEVSDTGRGIPEGQRARIFDWFHTTRQATGGSGLGLAISQDIVRRSGGTITVQSVVGEGSVFSVRLPAATDS